MNLSISTSRDLLVFQQDRLYLTVASDTLGAIGAKPGDYVHASPEICGRMTARVCLMETLAVGAIPFSLMALTCNERDPTGLGLLNGIKAELADSGFPDIPIGGSTEDNMPTGMTALGITLLGECAQPMWRIAQAEDYVYLLGWPCVGEAVLAHLGELMTPRQILQLRRDATIGDVIPCGSRGVAWELRVLEHETGLHTRLGSGIDIPMLWESAGPATCAIATSREPLENFEGSILKLGSLVRL